MSNSAPTCGLPINLDNSVDKTGIPTMGAHAMISSYLNMKSGYRDRLKVITSGDHHADRFFCADDVAYVFELSIIKAIVNAIENNTVPDATADGYLVLFQGLRKDPVKGDGAKHGFAFGRPTVVATAYVKGNDGNLHYTKVPYGPAGQTPDTVEAFEHPGNGTGGTTADSVTAPDGTPSAVVERTPTEFHDTDFQIKRVISLGAVHNWV